MAKLRGAQNGKWKGGVRINSDGYLQISAGPLRGKYVHILILEAKLGRKLRPDEEAHHLNDDRLDCRPENLEPRTIDGDRGHRKHLNGRPWWHWRRTALTKKAGGEEEPDASCKDEGAAVLASRLRGNESECA